MEEIEYLDFVDENNNVIEKEDLCMNDFDYLLEKAKEEKRGKEKTKREGEVIKKNKEDIIKEEEKEKRIKHWLLKR